MKRYGKEASASPAWREIAPDRLFLAWEDVLLRQKARTPGSPWWLDHETLISTLIEAATNLDWRASRSEHDDWDLWIAAMEGNLAIRCIIAATSIAPTVEERDVLADAWRVLALSEEPPAGTCGVQLVVAMPYVVSAGTDDEVRAASRQWQDQTAVPADVAATWFDPPVPLPRNAAGTAFPGFGVFARCLGQVS